MNTNKSGTQNRQKHVHQHPNTARSPRSRSRSGGIYLVQREIVGSGRFKDCWLVPRKQGEEGHRQHYAFCAFYAWWIHFPHCHVQSRPNSNPYDSDLNVNLYTDSTRQENEEPTCAAKGGVQKPCVVDDKSRPNA